MILISKTKKEESKGKTIDNVKSITALLRN